MSLEVVNGITRRTVMKQERANKGPMRVSPTMLSTWERSPIDWIRTYIGVPVVGPDGKRLLDRRRDPQNEPMAAGSAFDAYIKYELHKLQGTAEPGIPITETQDWKVSNGRGQDGEPDGSPDNTAFGVRIGRYLLDQYVNSGAYNRLLADICINAAGVGNEIHLTNEIFMEEASHGQVMIPVSGGHMAVPIGGIPDLFWYGVSKGEVGVLRMHDWKVSQIMNEKPTIMKGYDMMFAPTGLAVPRVAQVIDMGLLAGPGGRPGWQVMRHKDAGLPLEEINEQYATQLCFYAWLAGSPSGSGGAGFEPFIGSIDRLVGKPLRICQYRGIISAAFQEQVAERIRVMWESVQQYLDPAFSDPVTGCWVNDPTAPALLAEKSSFYG